MSGLSQIDIIVIVIYAIGIFGLAQWVSREKAGHAKDTSDYFLAPKSPPWWAIGASLIAANISAEQIVGMSGSGYALGLAIASYEWRSEEHTSEVQSLMRTSYAVFCLTKQRHN